MGGQMLLNECSAAPAACRPVRPGDVPAINGLFNDPRVRPEAGRGGHVPRDAALWTWEFSEPAAGDPAYVVASLDGAIVGTQAYLPITLLNDGRRLLSGKDEDTLVHPGWRRRGILGQMYDVLLDRARRDEVGLLWGFTSSAVGPLERYGFSTLGAFDAMRMDLRQRPRIESADAPFPLEVSDLGEPGAECDAYSSKLGRTLGGLMLHLSADYLAWRCLRNPYFQHHILAARRDGRLVGLGILKLDPRQALGCVADVTALADEPGDREQIVRSLLRRGVDLFRQHGLSTVEARPAGDHPFNLWMRGVLQRAGFVPVVSPSAPRFLVRPLRPDQAADLLRPERWRLCELMREY